jgi:predicted dienelactone hydrolase
VQVWHGANDETVPYATNVQIIEQGLGDHAETHTLPGATHLSFLAPCGVLKPPALCKDPGGFDRVAAHKAMNAEVVRFFATHLRGAGGI